MYKLPTFTFESPYLSQKLNLEVNKQVKNKTLNFCSKMLIFYDFMDTCQKVTPKSPEALTANMFGRPYLSHENDFGSKKQFEIKLLIIRERKQT